ncbi:MULTISPECIES: hypothetical protein [Aerosakkonema]|uniref:hypothetical protein n=1 Tax=Aerosakkonema TaxID=1246629 RepID=UPI0035BB019B
MQSIYINGKCYYKGDNGILLPAVSTILKATQPPGSITALSNWRKKVGNNEANRITTNSRRRGKALHRLIKEYLVQGKFALADSQILPYWYSIQSILAQLSDIELVEQVVPNYKESYAGKVDCVARYKGIPHAIEWTSAEEPKQSIDGLYVKPLQLVAYGGAINRCYGENLFGCKIKRALIVVALPNQDAQIIHFDREALIEYWREWQKRLKFFYQAVA